MIRNSMFLLLVAIIITSISCSKDSELSSSIYVSDRNSPELPVYSEWGYNTFGAYYDREVFVSNNQQIPLKILAHNGTTTFTFTGEKHYDPMKMVIGIKGFNPKTYYDLLLLNDSVFDLADTNYTTKIILDGDTIVHNIISGQIHFKRTQKLLIDNEETQVILSGVFVVKFINNNEPIAISEGRFDIGMGEYNFFSY